MLRTSRSKRHRNAATRKRVRAPSSEYRSWHKVTSVLSTIRQTISLIQTLFILDQSSKPLARVKQNIGELRQTALRAQRAPRLARHERKTCEVARGLPITVRYWPTVSCAGAMLHVAVLAQYASVFDGRFERQGPHQTISSATMASSSGLQDRVL